MLSGDGFGAGEFAVVLPHIVPTETMYLETFL